MSKVKVYDRSALNGKEFTLYNVIACRAYIDGVGHSEINIQLTQEEKDDLYNLLTHGAHAATRKAVAFAESSDYCHLPNDSIFERVRLTQSGWTLTAAQDYNVDMAYIRKLFRGK